MPQVWDSFLCKELEHPCKNTPRKRAKAKFDWQVLTAKGAFGVKKPCIRYEYKVFMANSPNNYK